MDDDLLHLRLRAYEGRPAAVAGVGRDPVNAPMIRHWCEAMGDANPAYTGPDAIAPPTMLQAWIMGGLSGHEKRAQAYDELLSLLDGAGCTAVVATDCEQEYARALRPGDEVAFDTVIESVSRRKTTKLGAGYFVTTRTEVRVAGTLVGTHRFRILKYAPAASSREPERPPAATAEATTAATAVSHAVSAVTAVTAVKEAGRPEAPARRPRPVVNRDNAGFWAGVGEHRFLIQRCAGCAALRFPWLPGCNGCGSAEWDTVEAGGEGTVFSYVVMHHPSFPAFSPPYAVGLIELAEGVRVISDVVDVPYDKVRIGMPVTLEFRVFDDELTLPVFRAREGAA
ncbi:bifunctional MaoC family dehydratase N-terminal/OB-fold nucleic acid binding domain-containing protein [Streptomyces hilarionis]|uniref:bifunctional MaoC family dehydratase N-terminal/OB-fold nucleic acid binding domain-containing protein n=1 Tax=Streptomyces hilarionis TaxID=2839954 RepID=UPI00211A00DE|nr:OB-fold domain-containing protein [Streptomyces hilarionis]MCQ9134713.1 OB-fold domain-containing protein [Streptomyces hilarionis]